MVGKYPPSKIHEIFSKWHYDTCKGYASLTDIDRLWVEIRYKKLVAVFDLKTPYEYNNYPEPETEQILRNFFEKQNIPYYVVVMDTKYNINFTIIRNDKIIKLYENEMIGFINNLGGK